ncbi:membrane lipoprotein lipid attachment site-containing protein [uncultured Chryseobacterium sp.]|uniref:membrane lipoprotein lipid attachment site-containing protein n=1 Tax=uncultured Chryseobacterium sp. TaxID=259322 RepID=UPI0025D7C4DB|nr:membrane lipoprotein lipid attachment site-containing protein [uncultured Chryseobacterium sp.]
MKKLILTAVGLAVLSACNKPQTNENTVKNEQKAVGADQDDHGCKASAGQTWSELKQNCIQVFNEGFRLNPVTPPKDAAVTSAFVLMSEDQSRLELFLPEQTDHHTLILNKSDKGMYQNDQYQYDPVKSVLYLNGVEQYKGNVE